MGRKPKGGMLPLFEYPLSRDSDPLSSLQAADRLATSREHPTQKQVVLAALPWANGSTSAELTALMAVDRYLTADRLADLEHDGLVTRGSQRKCHVTGFDCETWLVVTQVR